VLIGVAIYIAIVDCKLGS